MRIGIDLDDTLVKTVSAIKKIIDSNKYDLKTTNYRSWKEEEKHDFFGKFSEDVYLETIINEGAIDVINRLKEEGYEIWIVTARSNTYSKDVLRHSEEFLKNNKLKIDKVNFGISPKGKFCADNNIDVLVDDSPKQCLSAIENGVKAILFDSDFNQESDLPRAHNWHEVYEMLKQMEN